MRNLLRLTLVFSIFFVSHFVLAESFSVSTFPEKIIQGEPVKIVVSGAKSLSDISQITFDGKKVPYFIYENKITAFYGFDLNRAPGEYKIKVVLSDGRILDSLVKISEREKIKAPLGIPEKLGGNTQVSQTKLVSTLSQENAVLASLKTFPKSLWTEKFNFPIADPFVTDSYGYLRQTGNSFGDEAFRDGRAAPARGHILIQ